KYSIRINNLYDTQIAEMVLTCGLKDISASLLSCMEKYLGITIDKETRLEFLKIKDRPFSYKQLTYGASDIIHPLNIKIKQEELIEKYQLQGTLSLEHLFLPVLGDIEYKGMYF